MKKEKKQKSGWREIGMVGVDAGMLMICDPCYIDSEWEEEEVDYIEEITHPDGKREVIKRCSPRWFELINDINNGKVKLKTKQNISTNFSYNACCARPDDKPYNQINYKKGHEGLAVVFGSGFGDGAYPVEAKIVGGRVKEIRIRFF